MLFVQKRRQNTFCLDTYVIRDKNCIGYCCQDPSTLKDKIEIAIMAGYSAVELWHKDVKGFLDKEKSFDSIKTMMSGKIFVASYKVLENWFEGTCQNYREILETAAGIGAKSYVVKLIGDYKHFRDEPVSYYVDKYNELLSVSKPYNIKPSIEFMALANTMNSIDKVYDILEKIGDESASLVLDTWHLWRNDNSDLDQFTSSINRLNPKWVSVVHFTDAKKEIPREKQLDGDRKIPTLGCLNLSRFCRSMDSLDFKGVYSLNVYDRDLWDQDPLQVATKGLMLMKQYFNYDRKSLADSAEWDQKKRCELLWEHQYYTHLDPRISKDDRSEQLIGELSSILSGKVVLDFKCGFSPLSQYVTYGFDAYEGCVNHLKYIHPNKKWYCRSDVDFSKEFKEKIDVLLHIGLGDSNTEEQSHYNIRNNCKPNLVVIECAANEDGSVNESKAGNQERWKRICNGLKLIKTKLIKTNMSDRSYRLLVVGEFNVV